MTPSYRPTRVEVDLGAIRDNVRSLLQAVAPAELMAIVKADAYGHGAVPVARAALEAGATWLGVALVEEGLALRDAGIDASVLLLSEPPPGSESATLEAGLTPVLCTRPAVERLREAANAAGLGAQVHVKVDTGMHRIGIWPVEETAAFVAGATDAGLAVTGLLTHFARADEPDASTTEEQLDRFDAAVRSVRASGHEAGILHAANTAGALASPAARLDLVRTGLGIYGVLPTPSVAPPDGGLRAALTWRSAVTMARRLPVGEALSYGHRYRLDRDSMVATIPVGYADGYPRALSSRADVLIGGQRCRVAGSVTMDQIIVDCGDLEVSAGDEVVLLGPQGDEEVTATELAECAGTIAYEILAGIGSRIPREYVE